MANVSNMPGGVGSLNVAAFARFLTDAKLVQQSGGQWKPSSYLTIPNVNLNQTFNSVEQIATQIINYYVGAGATGTERTA